MRYVSHFMVWTVLVAMLGVGLLVAMGQLSVLSVKGTSMNPHLHEGDLVISWRTGNYQLGDTVSYRARWADTKDPQLVLHRIVRQDPTGWTLKGDNNATEDPALIPQQDVTGKLVAVLPGVAGRINSIQNVLWIAVGAAALILLMWPAREEEQGHAEREYEPAWGSA